MTTSAGASSLSLNFSKAQPLEFEVSVQGVDGSDPEVRFVLLISRNAYDMSLECTKTGDDTWTANIPKISVRADDAVSFRIEVIVDGYFFVPAEGDVIVLRDPAVKLPSTKPAAKPVVKTVFKTTESTAPISDVTQSPEEDGGEDGTEEGEDEEVVYDPEALLNLQETEVVTYDPRQIAADVIRNTIGRVPASTRTGSLFDRDAAGRVITPGVEHHDVAVERAARDAYVRNILTQQD